jgi:hypothetical protein
VHKNAATPRTAVHHQFLPMIGRSPHFAISMASARW